MGTFFTPLHHTNVFEKKVGKGYLLEIHFYGRSGVFTTSIHLNFYQVMSLHVYIFHFTTPPSPLDDHGGVGQGLARVLDYRALYAIVTPPYRWSIACPSGGEDVSCAKLVLWVSLVNLVMRLCKWKLQIQIDDHLLLDRGK